MLCQHCGKQIRLIRSVLDGGCCCAAHRRDAVAIDSDQPDFDSAAAWSAPPPRGDATPGSPCNAFAPQATRTGQVWKGLRGAGTCVGVVAVVLSVGILSFSNVMAAGRGATTPASRSLVATFPSTLTDRFESAGSDWIDGTVRSAAGVRTEFGEGKLQVSAGGGIRPGSLRLWKPTLALRNYELTLAIRIEDGSAGWVFRAADAANFYGAKLRIAKDRPGLNACIEHFVRHNGEEGERVCMPVPILLDPALEHRIRVTVTGDQFDTSIDGRLVDAWSDHRLATGGVGLFEETGDRAVFQSISVSERDSLLGRWFGYLSVL